MSLVALVAGLVVALLVPGCRNLSTNRSAAPAENAAGEAKHPAAQITVENGQAQITLDAATQRRLGVAVSTLASTVSRAQALFPAVVLSVQELPAERTGYLAAQAQIAKAHIQFAVEHEEYERLKALSVDDGVSRKSLEAAEAALFTDEGEMRLARQQLALQSDSLRQEWGDVVARWIGSDGPQLERLLDHSELLIQLTLPAASAVEPPKRISLDLPAGSRVEAAFLSSYPHLDPRIQGRSFLYLASYPASYLASSLAPSRRGSATLSELAPGLSLAAHLPVGAPLKGVVIPASAVVWSEGRAWVYSQFSSERFSRSPLSTELPVEGGYFAAQGFAPGDKIVTVGAQALLSEELLLHSQGGGDED